MTPAVGDSEEVPPVLALEAKKKGSYLVNVSALANATSVSIRMAVNFYSYFVCIDDHRILRRSSQRIVNSYKDVLTIYHRVA